MKFLYLFTSLVLTVLPARALTRQWTNTLGGDWFTPANWSPNGVPGPGDVANITNAGTYSVNILTGAVTVATLNLGAVSGTQTLLNGTPANLLATNAGTVRANGVLSITNGGLQGAISIQPSGVLNFSGPAAKNVYQLQLINQGTVTWSGGFLQGGSAPTTVINNGGMWQITGDNTFYNYWGGTMIWTNSGTLVKTTGSGVTYLQGLNFVNQPGGIVSALSGTLSLSGGASNILGGSLIATAPGLLTIAGGTWTDAGGSASGSGTNQLAGGTLQLRTNLVAGLRLVAGEVYVIGANTFQQAGAITNLVLEGAQLRGTNRVGSGTLTVNSGGADGQLTVLPTGLLALATGASKNLYQLILINQGTVNWSGGFLQGGSAPTTVVSNGGTWQITGDNTFYNYWGGTMVWTNSGTLVKTAGSGVTYFQGLNFVNQPGGIVSALSGTLSLSGVNSNILGGSLSATAPGLLTIAGGTWTDAGGSASGSGTNQLAGGTLQLRTNLVAGLRLAGGDVYVIGNNSFQQAGAITNLTLDGSQLRGTNWVGSGTLTVNSGGLDGQLTVLPAGLLALATAATKNLYQLLLINQGTVNWSGGFLQGGSAPTTVVSNGGLWQVTGDNTFYNYWGNTMVWTNSGTLVKTAGSGVTYLQGCNFVNQTSGLFSALSGTLSLTGANSNILGGFLSATAPGLVTIAAGTWTESGGSASGSGTNQLAGGILQLRTNLVSGLRLVGGDVYVIGPNSFQQSGAITNLTLDGSQLRGTNSVGSGNLTLNSGGVDGQLTVLPAGLLNLATTGSKNLYQLLLINQGTVNWSGGFLQGGSTPTTIVSNGGLWQITGDNTFYNYWGNTMFWTNSGTLRKSAGSGITSLQALNFVNQPAGLIQADTGTLQLPTGFTNTSGVLRLNGGTLAANGTLGFTGGSLEGSGTLGANALTGGSVTPGQSGPGLLQFNAGLNLSAGATVILSGTGTIPGTQYDQLSVTGAVVLANATLQVTSLPAVVGGTTFVLIVNDGADPVSGNFNGLPENSTLTVSGQAFRIHYAGGSGNDVTLVRDAALPGPLLTTGGGLTNGVWRFAGTGTPSGIYTIQATTNFIQWTNLGLATGDLNGKFSVTDSNAFQFRYRFYRTTN